MSFVASKLIWHAAGPTGLIVLLLVVGLGLQVTPWRRFGRRLVLLVAAALVAIALLPIGQLLLMPLEDRFPVPKELPQHVGGIILLGGAANPALTETREQPSLNHAVERIFSFVELARRYPAARLAMTGGNAQIWPGRLSEADVTRDVLKQIGFDVSRIAFEDKSRNTFENAQLARAVVGPKAGELWLLVTSAAHMPRAVGCFRQAGWKVLPYPVDYRTPGRIEQGFAAGLLTGLSDLQYASHEWIGMLVYWWLGRSDALFPAPDGAGR